MHRTSISGLLAVAALTVVLSSVVLADPPPGKGSNAAQEAHDVEHGPPQGKAGVPSDDRYDDHHGDDKGHKDDAADNRGQAVSECNHRANQRDLTGKNRQEYLEWCMDHGAHYKYDERYYNEDRSCYRKADEKGLIGDKRRQFINDCVRRHQEKRGETGAGAYGDPRAHDVPGKGSTH